MATTQISFYDESLKKQVEGSFVSDGKSINVRSAYGTRVSSITWRSHSTMSAFGGSLMTQLTRRPRVPRCFKGELDIPL